MRKQHRSLEPNRLSEFARESLPWCVTGVLFGATTLSVLVESVAEDPVSSQQLDEVMIRADLDEQITLKKIQIEAIKSNWNAVEYDQAYRAAWKELEGRGDPPIEQSVELPDLTGLPPKEELRKLGETMDLVRVAARNQANSLWEEDQTVEQWHKDNPRVAERANEIANDIRAAVEAATGEAGSEGDVVLSLELPKELSGTDKVQLRAIGEVVSADLDRLMRLYPDGHRFALAHAQWEEANREVLMRANGLADSIRKQGKLPSIEIPNGPQDLQDEFRQAVSRLYQEEERDEISRDEKGRFTEELLAKRDLRRVEFYESTLELRHEMMLFELEQQKEQLEKLRNRQ